MQHSPKLCVTTNNKAVPDMSMLSIATRNPSTSRNPQNGEMLKIQMCQMCQMCQAPCPGYICIYLLFHLHRVQRNTSRTERDSTPESVLTDDVHPLVLGSKDQRVCRHFSTFTFQDLHSALLGNCTSSSFSNSADEVMRSSCGHMR